MKGHKNSGQCNLDVVIIKYVMTNLKAGILIYCTCDEVILVYEKNLWNVVIKL